MAQNRSSAVMQQRHEAPSSLDHFPTPPWATRALTRWLVEQGEPIGEQVALEPACAEGFMARTLAESFAEVLASDCHDYGFGECRDFLVDAPPEADWIVTNPPFRLGAEFARCALELPGPPSLALFVRSAFLEGAERHQELFTPHPPSEVLQFVERVVLVKGRLVKPEWINPETGRGYSTATSYCWLLWRASRRKRKVRAPHFHWIAAGRRALEREGDYPPLAPVEREPEPAPLLDLMG